MNKGIVFTKNKNRHLYILAGNLYAKMEIRTLYMEFCT
jgi:hypothetical protein